ncbi:MAG: CehA/McbA family metallohydrolase [Sedimentisphaerales bacterium]|nr:CehA/McbA family metallohydrolase [Sedimentisphaerales bacterium]
MQNHKRRRITFVIVLAELLVCQSALGADTGDLSVAVYEVGSLVPQPCRAWVSVGKERLFNPNTKSCTPYTKDCSFSCNGYFVITIPTGTATIHIERGKEYRPVDKEVTVETDQTTYVKITLERWINMSREGWYSADMHCHFGLDNPTVLKQLALADDINLEPILTLWNHQQTDTTDDAWPNWPTGSSFSASGQYIITLRNQEIERIGGDAFESVGALLMFGLKRPIKMPQGNGLYPCDAVLARMARETSPDCVIDADKPIWGENVVGVALGLFDSVQVCHNHYHRESTLLMGWGMAGAIAEDEPEDWGANELFHRTNQTYYRFLNCGFELAVTGGSAMGVMPVPLGYSRTYAKLDGSLTEANYLKAIRAGRTFATSGPILILTANDLNCGERIQYRTGRSKPIQIKAELRSIQPIDSLELIANGEVIEKIDLQNRTASPVLEETLILTYPPKRSGWIAARAIFKSPGGRLRLAHTSPVYITVDGKPTVSKADAQYMIRWIDRLLDVSEKPGRYSNETEKTDVQAIYKKARQKYAAIAWMAEQICQDG